MKKSWVCCLQILFCLSLVKAQESTFYNANQSLLALNPSFAGSNGGVRNQFSYRHQWPGLSGSLVWYNNTVDAYIKPMLGGVALSVSSESQAYSTLSARSFGLAYAPHIVLNDGKVKIMPSLSWSYWNSMLDVSALRLGSMIDARRGLVWNNPSEIPAATRQYHDIAAGLLLHFENVYVGGSLSHLNSPAISHMRDNYRLPLSINAHVSSSYTFGEGMLVQGLMRYWRQGSIRAHYLQLNVVVFKHLMAGGAWRSGPDFSAIAGFRGHTFAITLGYDMSVSKLAGNATGSWEIHGSFNFRSPEKRKILVPFEEM
jgi:type IX secretion system PorP/SprF family membrane protein